MAYMNQEKKKAIAARIKAEFPNWSVRLSVHNHTSLRVTIVRADVDLLGIAMENVEKHNRIHSEANTRQFQNGSLVYGRMEAYFGKDTEATAKMEKFMDCVNLVGHPTLQNHDNSDLMSDYYDVGYYYDVRIGGNTDSTKFEYVPAKVKKMKAKGNAANDNQMLQAV